MVCALPPGSRRAHGQVDALAALDQVEELLQLRADRQATMAAVWRALVYAAEHETRTVTTTWAHLEAAAGCSRSTVARCLRWLRDVGLVGVVHTGASSAALGTDVNRAPTYVLAVPVRLDPVDEIDTPPGPFRSVRSPRTRASDAGELEPQGPALRLAEDPKSAPKAGRRPTWALSDLPVRSSERLAAAEALRWDAVTLRPITARMLRHILRPWFDAGWSPRDVLYALDHRPDGAAWTYAGLPRSPAAWVRWRLGAWAGPGGAPMPSRGQVARARAGVRARA